jgi:hypothetical protein
MNSWRSRLQLGGLIWFAFQVHSFSTSSLPNTPEGMLVFHGSAALADWLLLRTFPLFTEGSLCDDMEMLCYISIVANLLGWIAYLAYAPPVFYNTFMWGHSCVQAIRLLLVDGGDAHSYRASLVRRPYFGRA